MPSIRKLSSSTSITKSEIEGIIAIEKPYFTGFLDCAHLMVIVVALLVILVPIISTVMSNSETSYNHIFYYYSMMTQTFGAVVAIIAMVTTSTARACPAMKTKIIHFMILYISIIILSIIGIAIRTVPPIEQYAPVKAYQLIPLFIFESTLLLAIPAFVCLIALIKELYTSKLNKEKF